MNTELSPYLIKFSPREIQIIKAMAAGLNSKEIASQLKLTRNTVNAHRQRIFKKADTKNATETVAKMIRVGLIG